MGIVGAANFLRCTVVLGLVQHGGGWNDLAEHLAASLRGADLIGFLLDASADPLEGFVGGTIVGAMAGALGGLAALRRLPWRLDPAW